MKFRKNFKFFLAVGIIIFGKKFIITNKQVSGNSMSNAFKNGDVLLVQKVEKSIARYDVVIIKTKEKGLRKSVIKRVIGLPNETIQIKNGIVYIDGNALTDDISDIKIEDEGIAKEEIKLKEDEFFVLGDNRNNSEDSRSSWLGIVKKEQIEGKPFLKIYPSIKYLDN